MMLFVFCGVLLLLAAGLFFIVFNGPYLELRDHFIPDGGAVCFVLTRMYCLAQSFAYSFFFVDKPLF